MSLVFDCYGEHYLCSDWYILLKFAPTFREMILYDLGTDISYPHYVYEAIIIGVITKINNNTFNCIFKLKCSINTFDNFMNMLRYYDYTNKSLRNNTEYDYLVGYFCCIDYINYYDALNSYITYAIDVSIRRNLYPDTVKAYATMFNQYTSSLYCIKDIVIKGLHNSVLFYKINDLHEIIPYINKIFKILNAPMV